MSFVSRSLAAAVRAIGRVGKSIAHHAGSMSLLVWRVARATLTGEVSFRDIVAQAYSMGVQSIPLVCTTGLLSGVVTSQQGGYQFTAAVPLHVLGRTSTRRRRSSRAWPRMSAASPSGTSS